MSEDTKLDLAPIKAKAEKAHKMVVDLCKRRGESGSREWIMSIPARPDYDPDLVIDASLSDVPALVAEVERLREIKCDKVDCDRVEKDRREALARAETAEADVARLRSDLASCYRITGADPDGDDDAMLARKAVAAVKRLREESDTEAETADKRIAELEAAVSDAMVVIADMAPGETVLIDRLRSLLAKGGAA